MSEAAMKPAKEEIQIPLSLEKKSEISLEQKAEMEKQAEEIYNQEKEKSKQE